MKKNGFISLMVLGALVLASCLPDSPGTTYTSTFARIATIDHTVEPPRFYCDYTNEMFEFSNILTNADLAKYDLAEANRAMIEVTFTAVDYDAEYTFNGGDSIEILPVCNKDLALDDTFGPVYGFSRLEVDRSWAYPFAWVSHGYLNIIPQIKADKKGKQYLVPEGVSNDTLSFSLHSQYTTGSSLRAEFSCFDLTTLGDTATADAGAKPVMTEMIDKLNHTSDSVLVVVVADYLSTWPDTIVKTMVPTNYFYLHID